MIGLDANVVVRYIMQDDVKQSPMATRLIESRSAASPSFVPMVALVELVWVMSSAYELDKRQLIAALEGLLRTKEPVIEEAATVWKGITSPSKCKCRFCRLLDRTFGVGARLREHNDF